MSDKVSITDLLAVRDAEPVAADLARQVADDAQLQQRLQQTVAIKEALNDLAPEAPPAGLWQEIEAAAAVRVQASAAASTQGPTAGGRFATAAPRWGLATAAAVFAVALVGSLLWLPQLDDAPGMAERSTVNVAPANDIQQLVGRSQELERAVQSQVTVAGVQPSSSQRALMFRIADLDAELNSLQQESMHPELKERLWRQRVELLETLMEIQRYQMVEQADF